MVDFRTGVQAPRAFEQSALPDTEKLRLCRALLAEFGVTQVQVTSAGEMIHSCPLPFGGHKNGDASASASLNYLKLSFNCFGCGSSGGLLWLIATCRGENTDDSRRWLDDQTGSGPDEQSLASLLEFFDAVYASGAVHQAEPIPKMSPMVLKPWARIHPYLTDPIAEGGRGISEESLIRFQVGYAEAYAMGPSSPVSTSPRIVVPHFWKGDLVGWQTRRLVNDGTPKYVSSPSFPKDSTVYNYDPKRKVAVMVESPMSTLARADDVPHMEATFGAKVTDRQCSLLSMHPKVILWMDNDQAGWTSTTRLGDYLEPYSDVWVVDSPWNEDAGGVDSTEALRLLASPVPYALWRPPSRLSCWVCKATAHEGRCP